MAVMKFGGRILSNLFSRPATLNYPAEPREYPERSRGHVEFDPTNCILCGICSKKCPSHAVSVDKKGRTVSIDRKSCIQCSYCVDSCPKGCLSMRPGYCEPGASIPVDVFEVPEKTVSQKETD